MLSSFQHMATLLFFLFLSAFCSIAAAQQRLNNNTITLNSSLTPTGNSSWLSSSGLYAFGFYQIGKGFAVGIFIAGVPDKAVVWTANRDTAIVPSNVTLVLSNDGKLILQPAGGGQDINIVNLAEKISSASMLDSGNFVLYNSANKIIWQSFDHPTDTLLPGQHIAADQQLFSSASETDPSTGLFRLIMQQDGTLVLYPTEAPNLDPYAYWASYTDKNGLTVTLNLDDNGYMYLLKRDDGTIIFNLTQGGGFPDERTIYRAKLDVDGFLRLYSYSLSFRGSWSIRYKTPIDICDPKGICGLNAYCTKQDTETECKCIVGFDFISPGNFSSGCERNFSMDGCKSPNQTLKFTMTPLENTVWENAPYETKEMISRGECEQACLKDCNCEAALFKDGTCSKQRLPLKYGKRNLDDLNVALVKVVTDESYNQGGQSNLPRTIKKEVRVDILIIGISFLVLGALISVVAGVYVCRNRLQGYQNVSPSTNIKYMENVAPQNFTFAELMQATNEFKEELGRGAFGTVYKGTLPNCQKVVAVKRLEKVLAEGEMEFQNEILVIGKTHHRNLVRLVGYCIDGIKRILVYEYMSNGSLADTLFSSNNQPSWDHRIKIASEIARGILYLHEECETQIIHCDIKPQNILMNENGCAKISDFGLAKLLKHDQSKTFTTIRGTKGYVAPEWHRKLPITVKADIYSFGIVLLEIICCRRSIDWSLPDDEAILEEWAYDCFKVRELNKLVTDEEVDMKRLERVIKIAIWCIQDEPALRPSMKKVLLMLEGTVDIPEPPSPTSFLSST